MEDKKTVYVVLFRSTDDVRRQWCVFGVCELAEHAEEVCEGIRQMDGEPEARYESAEFMTK